MSIFDNIRDFLGSKDSSQKDGEVKLTKFIVKCFRCQKTDSTKLAYSNGSLLFKCSCGNAQYPS